MRAWQLARTYLRIGAMGELQYRANFFFQVLESALGLAAALAAVAIVFAQTDTLAGWRSGELVCLIGIYYLVLGSINLVIAPSLSQFMEDIGTGNLDFTLTKPVDAQLLVSLYQFRIWKLIDVVLGIGVLAAGMTMQASAAGPADAVAFVVAMAAGAVIVYSFWLLLATMAFWFIRVENILQIFWAMYMAGRWPVGIYPNWLKWTLTLVVPVAFAVTVPAEAVAGRLQASTLLGAVVLAATLAGFSRWFWLRGLRRYGGASA